MIFHYVKWTTFFFYYSTVLHISLYTGTFLSITDLHKDQITFPKDLNNSYYISKIERYISPTFPLAWLFLFLSLSWVKNAISILISIFLVAFINIVPQMYFHILASFNLYLNKWSLYVFCHFFYLAVCLMYEW